MRREPVQVVPVPAEPLTEPERLRPRPGPPVQTRLDDRLGQADLGRHPEPFVHVAPLAEEAAVALGMGREEAASRRVVDNGPDDRLQQCLDLVPPTTQTRLQCETVEYAGERGVFPDPLTSPVPARRKRRQQAPGLGAPEDDATVRNGEDVLPEGVGRSRASDRHQVGLIPSLGMLPRRHLSPRGCLHGRDSRGGLRQQRRVEEGTGFRMNDDDQRQKRGEPQREDEVSHDDRTTPQNGNLFLRGPLGDV